MAKAASNITVAREALLPALGLVTKAVERRSNIPILQNVLIETAKDGLTIVGSDLDTEIRAGVAARSAEGAGFTVNATTLHDAVRKLPDGVEIGLAIEPNAVVVTGGRAKFRLQTLPAADFPAMTTGDLPHAFTLPAATLARMIDAVDFAISTEETRYYLNGIHWHADGDQLACVATDGHRLARLRIDLAATALPGIIIPRRAVGLIRSLIGDKPAGDIDIKLSDSKIMFADATGRTLLSKLIDGTFPDYRRVIPSNNGNAFVIGRAALTAALDRVMTMATGRGSAVKLSFAADGGPLTLAASNPDSGSATDEVAIDSCDGQTVEIGFNGRYALDMLAALTADKVRFRLGSPGDPAIAEPVSEDGEQPLFVLMPMRV
jgi:DNA polymerase-3 subunit beta